MQALAQLLGFVCSWDKYSPFAVRATVLGAEVDLSAVEEEGVKVRKVAPHRSLPRSMSMSKRAQ